MKHHYILKGALAAFALLPALSVSAGWEQVSNIPTTQAHFITSEGIHLLSDYNTKRKGGIYYSEDKGATWVKTDVKDYNYSTFYEGSKYIFALGYNGRVARSEDGGRTWEVMNYTNSLRGIIPDKGIDECVAYGMTEKDGRIYVGDFNGGGILMSDDFGETWSVTDHASMTFKPDGVNGIIDAFYAVTDFNDQIYAFGALSVWRYDIEADKWSPVPVRSNFMAVNTIHGDRLVCGRAVQNTDPDMEYLLWTEDGNTWNRIEAPEPATEFGTSLNVRAIHSDGKYIFTAGPDGIRPDDSNPQFPFLFCPDFFYTPDFGETWFCFDGLPSETFPLTLTSDDDYVYTALYSPRPENELSGLWRLPKSELKDASAVKEIFGSASALNVAFSNGVLTAGETAESIEVWNASGMLVMKAAGCSTLDLKGLSAGLYVYKVVSAKGEASGKVVL